MMTKPRTWLASRAARLIGLAALVLAAAATSVSAETLMMPKRDARMGVSVVVWGVTTQANGSAFTLDYGDGSTPTAGNVADRSYIAFNHTYATQGTFIATLTVGAESATVKVQVFDQALLPGGVTGNDNRSLGINLAIEDGLRYLWTRQTSRAANFPDGVSTSWNNGGGFPGSQTSLAVLAFENHGYKVTNDNVAPTGLYQKYVVRRGLNYILTALSTQVLSVQPAGSPCVGTGIEAAPCLGYAERVDEAFYEAYTTPVTMLALAGSGALARTNTEAGGVTAGKTYREILQRMANTVVWGQIDPSNAIDRGGWYYNFNGGDFDGSTVGWAILALMDAEAAGITVPAFAKSEYAIGFDNAHNTDGSFDYQTDGNPASDQFVGMEKGGIPLQSMFFTGQAITPGSKGAATVTYLSNRWNTGRLGNDHNWGCAVAGSNNKGCAYSMFNAFKGLKLMGITTLPGVTRAAGPGAQPAGDWYADYQDWLIANQTSPTSPTGGNWRTMVFSCCFTSSDANVALAELILSPVALVLPDEDRFSTVGLNPATTTTPLGSSHTVTAKAESTGGTPVPGATVIFTVLTGPNAGKSGTGTTDANGRAAFTYTDTGDVGTDTIRATIGALTSNTVSATWTPITVSASFTAADKVYDAATAATVTSCTLAGVLAGDLVTCDFTAAGVSFADANVASGIPVSGLGFTLTGADAGKYDIGPVLAATANITPAPSVTVVTCPVSETYTGVAIEACTASATGVGGLSAVVTPVSYSSNTNVGAAGASATFAGDLNHTPSSGTGSFAITPAASTTVVSCAPSATYTGLPVEACTASVTGAGGLSLAVTPVSYTDNINVGTAGASASFVGDANHTGSTGSSSFVIEPAASTTVVSCTPSMTYTGSALTVCTANVTGVGDLDQAVTPVSYTDNINVGTAGASATYAGDANHTGSTGTGGFAITPADSTTVVSCVPSVTYTGSAIAVCTANVTGAGGLDQQVTPVTYSSNTNVGAAGASATYAGDANHTGSTGSGSFVIEPAGSTTVVTCTPSVIYTGLAIEVCTANVTGAGGLDAVVAPVTYSDNTNVGTAGARARYAGDANHAASTGTGSFAITVAPTTTVVTCTPSVTYTGSAITACTATVTGAGGLNEAVTPVTYSNNTNVGTAGASATYAGDANHPASTGTGSFAITAAPLSVTANNKARSHTAPNPVLDGTFTGVLAGDGITATYSTVAGTVPGAYAIVPALADPSSRLGNYSVTIVNGTMTLTNGAPVAVNDAHTGQWNTALVLAIPGVKANDSDVDADVLTATAVTAPSHGVVTLSADGSFTYLPLSNYSGADSFTYALNDGWIDSNVATVVITITTPCPPQGRKHQHHFKGDGDDHDRGRNGHRKGDGCEHDRDGDHHDDDRDDDGHDDDNDGGQQCVAGAPRTNKDTYSMKQGTTLAVSARSGVRKNDGKAHSTIALWSHPSHGTVTLAADGSFVYVPQVGFTGTDTFYYVARSANGIASHTERVTIRVTKKRGNDDDCSNSRHDHDKDRDWSHKGKKYKDSSKNDQDDDDRDGRSSR